MKQRNLGVFSWLGVYRKTTPAANEDDGYDRQQAIDVVRIELFKRFPTKRGRGSTVHEMQSFSLTPMGTFVSERLRTHTQMGAGPYAWFVCFSAVFFFVKIIPFDVVTSPDVILGFLDPTDQLESYEGVLGVAWVASTARRMYSSRWGLVVQPT